MIDRKSVRVRLARGSASPLLLIAMAGLHGSLQAQALPPTSVDGPAATPPVAGAPERQPADIIVTGSRIARRDYAADSPIVTVGQQFLQSQAGSTFGTKLQQLPQVTPGANELVGSGQPTGRATIDLRGLGQNRTLVLADGRRLQPSTSDFAIDLNTIPSALIDNVEVITGGASAVYGSDAIAGVVNLKLKHHFSGVQLSSQYNITGIGDGREFNVDALTGANFAEGRGNIIVAADYLNRGLATFIDRAFYRKAFPLGAAPWGSDLLPQGNFIPDAGNLPSQAAVNAVFARYGVAAGKVAASNALSFNQDASQSLFSQSGGYNYTGPLDQNYVLSPFSNSIAYNLGPLQYLTAPTKRYNLFSRGEYEIADDVTFYVQGIFTDYKSITNYGAGLQTQGTTAIVPADYAFAPADLQTLLASRPDPTAAYDMHKLWLATGTSVSRYDNTVYQILAGLKGKIGSSWTWDVYGSHGETKIDVTQVSGGASFSRIQALITSRSVINANGTRTNVPQSIPAANGSGTYIPNPAYATAVNDGGRSYVAADGSVPCPDGLNLFSNAVPSASCSAFLQIHPTNLTRLNQDVVEGTLSGPVFNLPAGPLQVAIGGTYRRNTYSYSPDPSASDEVGSFASYAVGGATEVKEGYAEISVPLLKDLPFFKSLEVDAAYRYSDYRLSGSVSTYKASVDWAVIDAVRLRGGYQRAIRAPNVIELFNPTVPTAALLGQVDPCNFDSALRTGANASQIRSLCLAQGVPASIIDTYKSTFAGVQAIQSGNAGLKPEKANTFTGGVVLKSPIQTPLLRKLSLSVDYYNLNLKQAISTLSADFVFASCFNLNGSNPGYAQSNSFCQGIQRNAASGTPDQVLTPYYNLGGIRTSGVDIQLDWGIPLEALGLPARAGRLDLNVVANRLIDFKFEAAPGAGFADYAGFLDFFATGNNGAHPFWKMTSDVTYSAGPVAVNFRWYYVGPMTDAIGNVPVKSYSRFDLSTMFDVKQGLQIGLGVSNLTNKQPLETFGGLPGNTDSGTYDPLGRRFFISAQATFK